MNQTIRQYAKNLYIRFHYYNFKVNKHSKENSMVFFIKKGYHKQHPGLVDRFKAIVGLYYIAKVNGWDFKLDFKEPFVLEKYLIPNKVDWHCSGGDISYNVLDTRLYTYDAFRKIDKLNANKKQYHCYLYTGFNVLERQRLQNWETLWGDLFSELFKPSEHLEQLLNSNLPKQKYLAVHLRFVNALDNFEEGYNNQLSPDEKEQLIRDALNALAVIESENKIPLVVFSDSAVFLKRSEQQGYCVLGTDNIGHITFETETQTFDKTFLDFFSISRAEKIYVVHGSRLYNSVFPKYAAIVGKKEFRVVEI